MNFEPLNADIAEAIIRKQGGNGWKNDAAHWARMMTEHEHEQRWTLVATEGGEALGYGSLLWRPHYRPFAVAGIPEIQDISVAQASRGRGIATSLIGELEGYAIDRGYGMMGIGVGLYADYGAAQRLYMSLGYRPDGRGVTCNGEQASPGTLVRLNDDLVLWSTKTLPRQRE